MQFFTFYQMNFREFLALFRAGREGQGKELKPAKIFRCGSEGAAEGGCGGNSAAPERSAGAKRRRSVPFKIGSRIFKQRAHFDKLSVNKYQNPPLWRVLYLCAPGRTRTFGAHKAGDLQSPGIAAIRPAQITKSILTD